MIGLRLVADDLTGALDSAAAFCGRFGPIPVVGRDHIDACGDAMPHAAFDLATRELDASFATAESARFAARLGAAEVAYKKIDSRLRGHWALELAATLAHEAFALCVLAPAFPAQGRTTVGGRQIVRAIGDASVIEAIDTVAMLRAAGLRPRVITTLESDSLHAAAGEVLLFDATTDDDLRAVVRSAVSMRSVRVSTAAPARVLWCGSAGLARAIASSPVPIAPAPKHPLLAIVGTDNAVARRQVQRAVAAGVPWRSVVHADIPSALPTAAAAIGDTLARSGCCGVTFELPADILAPAAKAEIEQRLRALLPMLSRPAAVVVMGGETLASVCRAVGATHLVVDAERSPGVPHSTMRGGLWDGVDVVSKSGGFGDADWLVETMGAAHVNRHPHG